MRIEHHTSLIPTLVRNPNPSHTYIYASEVSMPHPPNPPLHRGLTISKLKPCSCAIIWGEVKASSADIVGAVMYGSLVVAPTSCMHDVSLSGHTVWMILPCSRCSLGLHYPNLSSFGPMSNSQERPVPDLEIVASREVWFEH